MAWDIGLYCKCWRLELTEHLFLQVEETKPVVEQKEVEKGSGDAKVEASTEAADKE